MRVWCILFLSLIASSIAISHPNFPRQQRHHRFTKSTEQYGPVLLIIAMGIIVFVLVQLCGLRSRRFPNTWKRVWKRMPRERGNRLNHKSSNDESNDESNDKPNDESNDESNDKPNDESNDESNDKPNDESNDRYKVRLSPIIISSDSEYVPSDENDEDSNVFQKRFDDNQNQFNSQCDQLSKSCECGTFTNRRPVTRSMKNSE